MAITDEKKDLLLGQDSEELIKNADDNFISLFDTVDDLKNAIDTKEPKIEKKNSAFNKDFATATPAMDSTASTGTADTVARGDHVHPHDTSKLDVKPDGTNALIENSKINTVYLPDSVLGQLVYQGTFDASTAGTTSKTKGHYYICGTAGSYNPDGTTGNTYAVGDWAIYNGASWDKVDNTDAVTLVNGQTGSVKTYKGAYASGTTYYQGDIVLSDSCLYLYINATASSGKPISNTEYWKIFGTVYVHPTHTQKEIGLYKITVDNQGHVSGASAVTKTDITDLGIPAQDTTYGEATESASGLMSATDKAKLNAIDESLKDVTADEIGKVKDVQVNGKTVLDESTGIANIVINVSDLKGNYVENITPTAVTLNDKSYKAIVVEETDVTLEVLNSEGKAVVTQVIRANGNIYYCLPSTDENTYTLRKVGGNSVSADISELEKRVSNLETGKRQFNFSCSVDNVTAYSDEIFTPTVIEMEDMTFDGKTGVDAFIAKRGYMLDNQDDPEEGYVFYHYSGTAVTKTYLDGGEEKTIEIFAGYWKITDRGYDIESVMTLPTKLTKDLGNVNIRGFFVYKSSDTTTDYKNLFLWLAREFDVGAQNKTIENISVRYCEESQRTDILTLKHITIPRSGLADSYIRFVYDDENGAEYYFDVLCTDIKTKVISIS